MLELLGQVQQATGDATLAVGTFSKLVAAQPDAVGPLLRLAGALVAVKDYDKAIEKLREALKINPELLRSEPADRHRLRHGRPQRASSAGDQGYSAATA